MTFPAINVSTDKAYLMGLLVGGGIIYNETLQIILPYKEWGNLLGNPERGGQIASDIIQRIGPIMRTTYGLSISYDVDGEWKIVSPSLSQNLIQDLAALGLPRNGEFRDIADIRILIGHLNNREKLRNFLAGLTDAIGSMVPSHRRYTDTFQIVSFEFKGKNFALVTEIANLFVALGAPPDQILWNHPNQHAGIDRYYKQWKKGFKVRLALDDYIAQGSFVCRAKRQAAIQNTQLEPTTQTTLDKTPKIKDLTTVHMDENSTWLPEYIRGYHFIHYLHLAEFLGLHLPGVHEQILDGWLDNASHYITPFTVLTKRTASEIRSIVRNEPYLAASIYRSHDYSISDLLAAHDSDSNGLVWGNDVGGFPINYLLQGISFVVAASTATNIKGNRVLGNYIENIEESLDIYDELGIRISTPNRGTCLIVENDRYAALVGYYSNDFTATLLTRESRYGIRVREPRFEECVRLPS